MSNKYSYYKLSASNFLNICIIFVNKLIGHLNFNHHFKHRKLESNFYTTYKAN